MRTLLHRTVEVGVERATISSAVPVPNRDIGIPQWIRDVLKTKQYWLPIVIGIVLANAELKRRRRNVERDDRAGDPPRPGTGASE